MEHSKISARRYGRMLAVLTLKQQFLTGDTEVDKTEQYQVIQQQLNEIPPSVESQIFRFCNQLLEGIEKTFSSLETLVNTYSKNRTLDQFSPLDKALLLVGTYDLGHNSSDPKICVKEILIISDSLNNVNAAPYISGVLKSIAYGDEMPKKRPKIRLRTNN